MRNVGGFTLVYQTWSPMMGGNGVSGTIRTVPENYYVATIDQFGGIAFEDLEACTRKMISKYKKRITNLWKHNKIGKGI